MNVLSDTSFIPSQSHLDTLYDLGKTPHPYMGFARSLYYVLTDSLIELDLPAYTPQERERTRANQEVFEVITFPNPVSSSLQVQIKNASITTVKVQIFDIAGRNLMTLSETTQNFTVNVSELKTGIYILRIENSLGIKRDTKINIVD